jgi:hypothetical protein
MANYTYGPVKVKGTASRRVVTADGSSLDFVSIYTEGGEYTPKLWAFSTDLPTLPTKGDTCTFTVAIRAKANPQDPSRPRLTVRVLSFETVTQE